MASEKTGLKPKGKSPSEKPGCCFRCCICIPQRYLLAVLSFLGFMNLNAMKTVLSISIIPMTNGNNTALEEVSDVLDWDTKMRGVVLGMFTVGFAISPPIGALILRKTVAGKWLFGVGILVSSIMSMISPVLSFRSAWALTFVRFIQGLFLGLPFGAIFQMLSVWVPPQEYTVFGVTTQAGLSFGAFVSLLYGGLLVDYVSWESTFYVAGGCGLVWCILWFILISETPHDSSCITKKELDYITESKEHLDLSYDTKIPWRDVLTSGPVWALFVSHVCFIWTMDQFYTDFPRFIHNVVRFTIRDSAIIIAAACLLSVVVTQVGAIIVDKVRSRYPKHVSTTCVRKTLTAIGGFGQAVCLLLLTFSYHNKVISTVFACLSATFHAFICMGSFVNYLDIAPQYANTIQAIGHFFARLISSLGPIMVGFIVTDKNAAQWNTVLYISVAVGCFGTIFFLFFGSGEVQEWAMYEPSYVDINGDTEAEETSEPSGSDISRGSSPGY